MPKKSSRAVQVDGRPYRFIVQSWDGHDADVRVLVEDSTYPGHPLETRVGTGYIASRGIGGPQIAVLVRLGIEAGWKPATDTGRFWLDSDDAGRAIEAAEDDDRRCVDDRVRSAADVVQEALNDKKFEAVDRLLGGHNLEFYGPVTLMSIARVTKPHAEKLQQRNLFLERITPILYKRFGDERAEAYLATRR